MKIMKIYDENITMTKYVVMKGTVRLCDDEGNTVNL